MGADQFIDSVDTAVLAAWRAALDTLASLGTVLVPVDLDPIEEAHQDGYLALMVELASLQEPERERMDAFDPGTRARIEQGRLFSGVDYLRALRRRPLVQESILRAMDTVDVLVTPGVGGEAPTLADLTLAVKGKREPLQKIVPRNTMIFDYTGQPALMIPSGQGLTGLPLGVQIVGRPFDDALCLSVGSAFQRATDFHRRAPADVHDPAPGAW